MKVGTIYVRTLLPRTVYQISNENTQNERICDLVSAYIALVDTLYIHIWYKYGK